MKILPMNSKQLAYLIEITSNDILSNRVYKNIIGKNTIDNVNIAKKVLKKLMEAQK